MELGVIETHDSASELRRLDQRLPRGSFGVPGAGLLAYGGVATGYKSASSNDDGPAFGGADSEEITSIELGFKSEWGEGRLQVNTSVFLYDYDNPHISFIDNATGGQTLLSIDKGEVYGFDLDFVGIAGQRTNWFVNLTTLESEYEDDTAFFNADLGLRSILAMVGKQMEGASPLQVAASLDYSIPLTASGELIISPSVNLNSGTWYDAENRVGTGGVDDGECFPFDWLVVCFVGAGSIKSNRPTQLVESSRVRSFARDRVRRHCGHPLRSVRA